MQVTVELLDCGTLTAPSAMFEADTGDEPVTIPVPSWLIRHPQGLVLLDCGMHSELTVSGPYLETVSPFFEVGLDQHQLIAGAIADHGVDPGDIDVVILSHLHFDHAGGLAQVPDARVVVQAMEWAAGADDELAAANAYIRPDYQLGHDVIEVDGEHDVFDDGAITCIPTPGHTPGHQSVRVRSATLDVVLCCDCVYFERTLDGAALPAFGHDLAEQAASIERLSALGADGARLIPGHDPSVFAGITTPLQ